MNITIIIPAFNEEKHIGKTLQSLVNQSLRPTQLLVVDDGSNDSTPQLVNDFCQKYDFIKLVKKPGAAAHLPGSKVVQAFNYGLQRVQQPYEIVCKFDADLIFPTDYLQKIAKIFLLDPKIGMVGGFCYIEKNGSWVLENLTNKDHIRGALKAYRKSCFETIGGLKTAMGWDTLDELLTQYHGWKVVTDETLQVKHLKPTGQTYSAEAKLKQGEAFYSMRYGFMLTLIAAAKLAVLKKKPVYFLECIKGFLAAKSNQKPFLVSEEEGKFIRNLRWSKIKKKLF